MSLWCPSCRKEWPDSRQVCRTCFTPLVADLDATVVCRHCGTVCPAHRHSCPNCLAELNVDPERAAEAIADMLARGHRLPRPAGTPAFADGASCSLLRIAARSSLIYCGASEFMEASVDGIDHRAIPPLRCVDIDDTLLFRLDTYAAHPDAVVAVDAGGAPMATYLRTGLTRPGNSDSIGYGIHVRDETSAPVATLRPSRRRGALYELVETGGDVLAVCDTTDVERDGWVDDQWSLQVRAELPLQKLAGVGILLAAKVLLGRPSPAPVARDERPWEDDDLEQLGRDSPGWSLGHGDWF